MQGGLVDGRQRYAGQAYRFDRFALDLARGACLGPDGAVVPLRPKSFALLRLLVEHPGRLLDRDAIMAATCDIALGACSRELSTMEQRYTGPVCGGILPVMSEPRLPVGGRPS